MTSKPFYPKANKMNSCPFCGSADVRLYETKGDKFPWQVACHGCSVSTDRFITEGHAVGFWNKRVNQ